MKKRRIKRRAVRKPYGKKRRRGRAGSALLVFFALAALLILVPLAVVWLFSPDREQQKLVFDPIDIEEPDILVWLEESDTVVTVPLEEYIACVVSEEMPASFDIEALKAQAVAARSYSVARTLKFTPLENPTGHQKAALCNTTHCQVYKTEEEIRQSRSEEWMQEYWPKIREAVDLTAGQVLCYNGELAGQTMFHSSSGGRTENSEDVFVSAVPYLRSVDSPYEDNATHQNEITRIPVSEFVQTINASIEGASVTEEDVRGIQITARSSGDRAQSVQIGAVTVSGKELRSLFDLSSANFEVSVEADQVVFVSNGYGHGVGLSQYGANGMAEEGFTYQEILEHYYTGTEIRTLKPKEQN